MQFGLKRMETDYKKKADTFIVTLGNMYGQVKKQMKAFCFNKGKPWSEDLFQDTLLKCYDSICRNGLRDTSELGCLNYFFMSFKTNIIRETQYAYNKLRDTNIDNDIIKDLYEDYCNNNLLTEEEKIKQDLYQDFILQYILTKVEENFPLVDYRLFSIKMFYKCTYKRLKELTHIKDVKKRLQTIQDWLKNNIDRHQIDDEFEKYYNYID